MSKTILVIDDDPGVVAIAKHAILSKGYEVITAKDGMEGLEILKGKKPDLILLDVQMPRLDGYGFIRQKFNDPDLTKIPVVVLTAMGKTEPLFKRYGVKAYLLKPINTQDLLEKINTLVGS
jgi:CheY-like chemotaxis protein